MNTDHFFFRKLVTKLVHIRYSGVTRALMGGWLGGGVIGWGGVYSYIRVLPDGFLLK